MRLAGQELVYLGAWERVRLAVAGFFHDCAGYSEWKNLRRSIDAIRGEVHTPDHIVWWFPHYFADEEGSRWNSGTDPPL